MSRSGCALCVAALIASPASLAHARFGRAGHSSAAGGGGGSSGRASSSGGHGGGYGSPARSFAGPRALRSRSPWGYPYYAPAAPFFRTPPRGPYEDEEDETPALLRPAAFDADVTLAVGSELIQAYALAEARRFGMSIGYTGVVSTPVDGEDYTLHLAQAHVTYALLQGPRARLRAEFGVHFAVAPDVTFIAPGAGLSGVLAVTHGFGFEARLFGNFWPYTQVDASGGIVVDVGSVALMVGGRILYVDDNGALGAANAGETSDLYSGPYAGVFFAL